MRDQELEKVGGLRPMDVDFVDPHFIAGDIRRRIYGPKVTNHKLMAPPLLYFKKLIFKFISNIYRLSAFP